MDNITTASLIVDELVRLGITQFVISPGSRSTPLTVAIARHTSTRSTVHFDERGAAFYALGHGRASGMPAVLVCTSGTAAANYFPAIVESSMDNVPLIVISADRPPELIGVGANQAIYQDNIYGVYPRFSLTLPPPDPSTTPENVLEQVDLIFDKCLGSRPGPVHLNCQFREPLLPDHKPVASQQTSGLEWFKTNSRYTSIQGNSDTLSESDLSPVSEHLQRSKRGLIIVGRSVDEKHTEDILKLATQLNLPVFPDVQSKMRFIEHPHIIHYFDLAFLTAAGCQNQPDFIIHFGSAFTSKRLLKFIDDPSIFYVSIKETSEVIDPNHQVNVALAMDIKAFCEKLSLSAGDPDKAWLSHWQLTSEGVSQSIDKWLELNPKVTEPGISYRLSRILPKSHALMLGNSMPIRDMEMFGSPGFFRGRIFANRGSSGIDGLLATAAGIGSSTSAPITLLIGDLAFLHDLNSMYLIKTNPSPIIIVVVNNDGGGIFNFLPVSQEKDVHERFFGTPHGLNLESICHMFEIPYSNPVNMDEFEASYLDATQESKSAILELVTNRAENHEFHEQIFETIRNSN